MVMNQGQAYVTYDWFYTLWSRSEWSRKTLTTALFTFSVPEIICRKHGSTYLETNFEVSTGKLCVKFHSETEGVITFWLPSTQIGSVWGSYDCSCTSAISTM